MRVLDGKEKDRALHYIVQAGETAKLSTCTRAHCGAVIVNNGAIIGRGANTPPKNLESQRRCDRKDEIPRDFKSDTTCCIHAEARAIHDAMKNHSSGLEGSTMYFMRRKPDDYPAEPGEPYCTMCSKAVLDAGIKEFVKMHAEGVVAYDSEEYNDVSYASDRRR